MHRKTNLTPAQITNQTTIQNKSLTTMHQQKETKHQQNQRNQAVKAKAKTKKLIKRRMRSLWPLLRKARKRKWRSFKLESMYPRRRSRKSFSQIAQILLPSKETMRVNYCLVSTRTTCVTPECDVLRKLSL